MTSTGWTPGRHRPHRVVEEGVHQVHDLRREGGGKKEGLLFRREELEYPADIVDKPHVQHAVGLVQDEDLHPAQVQQALAGQVQQTAPGWR